MTIVSMEVAHKWQSAHVNLEVDPVTRKVQGGDILETPSGHDGSRRVG
jgi:hypothetical protein